MRVTFYTLGCKVNQNETGALAQLFEENGYTVVSNEEGADVYIVNSCTVTNFGDQKSRKWLRRAKRENPGAVTVLTGCYPQAFPDEAAEIAEADVVTGSGNRHAILTDVQKVLNGEEERVVDIRPHEKGERFEELPMDKFAEHTRAFVKVEDGCNRRCAYCVIPRARGPVRSRDEASVLEELRRGRYADAAQLPSELELADVLGVSRTVVRDALSDLERDGYLERVRGIGTLVNRDVVRVENRMDQKLEFNRMIRSIGRVPHSDNLMVTRETAMPELAAKLGLDPEREHTLVFVRRRVLADETPVLYSTDILPLALFGGKRLDTIDFSRPIFEIVEQHCHVEVTETLTTLHAVQGVPGIRRQLGLRPEQALLQLDEICYSRTCKPVLCCQTCYTDFFDFAMVRKLI